MKETIEKEKCLKCKNSWWPRVADPKRCPFCGCRNWSTWGVKKKEEDA